MVNQNLQPRLSRTRYSKQLFDWNNGAHKCYLRCMQCIGKTQRGKRCRRFSCYALPYCKQHLSEQGLTIQKTHKKHGNGLFAKAPEGKGSVVFRENRLIVPYMGESLSKRDLDARYGNGLATYAYALPKEGIVYVVNDDCLGKAEGLSTCATYPYKRSEPYAVDAGCVRGVGSLANSPYLTGKRANAEFAMIEEEGKIPRPWLVSIADIKDGEEILVSYGPGYFKGEPEPHKTEIPKQQKLMQRRRLTNLEALLQDLQRF